MSRFPIHTALAILTLGALLFGARALDPAIQAPRPSHFAEAVSPEPERAPLSPLVEAPPPEPALPVSPKAHAASRLLEDDAGVLDAFYESLWKTEKREPNCVTRIVHYGDSPTTADLITGDSRQLLQKTFGDAGHGFVLPAKPWAWYQHHGVDVSGSGWQIAPASRFEAHDGLFGLGGVSLTGSAGAHSRITFTAGPQSHLEIWFLRQPGGGALSIAANGSSLGLIETAAEAKTAAFAAFDVPGGATTVDLRVEKGSVRVFGLTAEKDGPGVVYDSLGLNGASITVMTRMFNRDHWTGQLQHRNPSLVIVNYGTNEADFAQFVEHGYEKELRQAILLLHTALPEAAILIVSPMDRGHRVGQGEIQTMPTIPAIVATERRVAKETGCGFFDTYTAMGGEGTMARWYTDQPRLVSADLIHPYPAGGRRIAEIFVRELEAGLNRYKVRQVAVP